mmetsp:Transcript_51257/g.128749  ORF Transcript_51257/g.128749 Transcript_51257/m.128749 type:complete len:207 (-) Transcript_51257:336-956(-)
MGYKGVLEKVLGVWPLGGDLAETQRQEFPEVGVLLSGRRQWGPCLGVGDDLDGREHCHVLQIRPWVSGRHHFDDHTAHTPDVAATTGFLVDDFGSHPVDGPLDGDGGAVLERRALEVLHLVARTEVRQLRIPIPVDEYVGALNVPVEDPLVMQIRQTFEDLPCVLPNQTQRQRTESLQHGLYGAARHVLHEDDNRPLGSGRVLLVQ